MPAYKIRCLIACPAPTACARLSPDGHLVAIAAGTAIFIRDALSGRLRVRLAGHTRGVNDLAWSPCSRYLASAADDYTIRLWALASPPRPLRTLRGHSYLATAVRFTPKGNLLVSAAADEAIRIWDPLRARCLKTLSAHSDPISSLDLSWDGSVLASASYDGLIRLFDVASGQCLKTLMYEKTDSSFPISYVKFSPNGKYLLSSSLDGIIRLWDYTNNKVVKTYRGQKRTNIKEEKPKGEAFGEFESHSKSLEETSIAEKYSCATEFITASPEPWIASGAENGTVMVWNLDTKQIVDILSTGLDSPVLQIDTIDNGRVMLSASMGGVVQLWDLVDTEGEKTNKEGTVKEETASEISEDKVDQGDVDQEMNKDNIEEEKVDQENINEGKEKTTQ